MSGDIVGPGEVRVGWRRTWRRTIEEADIRATIALNGDQGGYHVDEAFARAAGFRQVIAPGLLQAGMVTKIGGDLSFLAREITFRFLKPVYAGDTLEVDCRCVAFEPGNRLVTLEAEVTNQDGDVVLSCRTVGHLPKPEWGDPVRPG